MKAENFERHNCISTTHSTTEQTRALRQSASFKYSFVRSNYRWVAKWKKVMWRAVLLVSFGSLSTKFVMNSFIHSKDTKGSGDFINGSRDRDHAHFGRQATTVSYRLDVINIFTKMECLYCTTQNVEGPKMQTQINFSLETKNNTYHTQFVTKFKMKSLILFQRWGHDRKL